MRTFQYAPAVTQATQPVPDASTVPVFHSEVRQVLLMIFVASNDLRQKYANGLRRDDFHVFVDNAPAVLQSFEEVIVPKVGNAANGLYFIRTTRGAWLFSQPRGLMASNYYLVGFTPPESKEGVCHQVSVHVASGQYVINPSPNRYCYSHSVDPLKGTDLGDVMEAKAQSGIGGGIKINVSAHAFYAQPGVAQVHISAEIPKNSIIQAFKGGMSYVVEVHALGLIYGKDSALVSRFSDNYDQLVSSNFGVYSDFAPMQFASEVNLPPGDYQLKFALSDDKNFGASQTSFHVDAYDGRTFGVSSVALSTQVRSILDSRFDHPHLPVQNPSPLVSQEAQFIPSAEKLFDKSVPFYAYFELYEPLLAQANATPPTVGYRMKILDAKDGAVKMDSGLLSAAKYFQKDSIVIPIGEKLNLEKLTKGCYRLEVQAADSAGQSTPVRSEQFCVK